MFKKDTKDYSRNVKNMLTDLENIKKKCIPDAELKEMEKKLDQYGKKRKQLIDCIKQIEEGKQTLSKKSRNKRDQQTIKLGQNVRNWTKDVANLYQDLETIYKTDTKKRARTLGKVELARRSEDLANLKDKIQRLTNGKTTLNEGEEKFSNRKERKRKGKKNRMGGGNNLKYTEVVMTAEEEKFQAEVKANRDVEDGMLDQISDGLDELKIMSEDINNTLGYHKALIEDIDSSLENVNEDFISNNARLQKLLDDQGGANKWCCRICFVIILLSAIGWVCTTVGLV